MYRRLSSGWISLAGVIGVLAFLMASAEILPIQAQPAPVYLPLIEIASTGATPVPTPTPALTPTPDPIWRPAPRTSWDWQLTGPFDFSRAVAVYDVDLFEQSTARVTQLHTAGHRVICYVSVGSWEDWRPDAGDFPAAVLGNEYAGWAGERWLDIRRIDLLGPIMRARLDLCRQKGFDAVEPDNIDGYQNDTGFALTAADQLRYNRWLANEAHVRRLSIGLKNDSEQVTQLIADFDWALTEDCFDQGWCSDLAPFLDAGKAVFAAEYTDTGVVLADFCAEAQELGLSPILKHRDLDSYRLGCPPD